MGSFISNLQHSQQGSPSFVHVVEHMVSIPFSMSMLIDIVNSSYSSHGHFVNGVCPSGTVTWSPGQWQVCLWWVPELSSRQVLSKQIISELELELGSGSESST